MFNIRVDQYQEKTVINLVAFGHVVYSEDYPKYHEGTGSFHMAVKDAEHRFARKIKEALNKT